ncbi:MULTISPECIES: hypothetical protein [unclassified Burkholderia]|uniref:hypothetical protein n=1 Tax=unclassified Burkholderia TaxID=2613784 RepID=UPI00163A0CF1|nr:MULTISPECIES: hypothetical protein [unclassified Burkholderia]
MSKTLTDSDVYTLIGHAEMLRGRGETDMPVWCLDLAYRIAIGIDESLAARVAELRVKCEQPLATQQPEPRASLTDDERDKIERAEACLRGRGPEDVEAANGLLDVLTAHPVQPEPRDEVTDDDVSKLKRFAGLVLKDHRNGGYPGDVDGAEIQGYAEQCGLIEERRMEAPCGESCSCTDFGEFPTTCYFNTCLGKAVIDAALAQRQEKS